MIFSKLYLEFLVYLLFTYTNAFQKQGKIKL